MKIISSIFSSLLSLFWTNQIYQQHGRLSLWQLSYLNMKNCIPACSEDARHGNKKLNWQHWNCNIKQLTILSCGQHGKTRFRFLSWVQCWTCVIKYFDLTKYYFILISQNIKTGFKILCIILTLSRFSKYYMTPVKWLYSFIRIDHLVDPALIGAV